MLDDISLVLNVKRLFAVVDSLKCALIGGRMVELLH